MPEGIEFISFYTFRGCSSLKSIVIPDNVKQIRYGAFYDCNSLTYINVPENVREIYSYAFAECDSLEYVCLGKGVQDIYSYAFEGTNVKDFYCLASTAPSLHGEIHYKVGSSGIPERKSWHDALVGLEQATLHIWKSSYSSYNKDIDNMEYFSTTWLSHFKEYELHTKFTETNKGWE